VIDRLRNEKRKWAQVIVALEQNHWDWPAVQEYVRAGRTADAYRRIYQWARATVRRYREWKNHI
jgi:hypothetical protein